MRFQLIKKLKIEVDAAQMKKFLWLRVVATTKMGDASREIHLYPLPTEWTMCKCKMRSKHSISFHRCTFIYFLSAANCYPCYHSTHAYTLHFSKSHAFQPHTAMSIRQSPLLLLFHLVHSSHCHISLLTK